MSSERPIVPGISVDAKGHARIDASLQDVLFDLALKLEEVTNLPVDVQHVVAALVLAERRGQVNTTQVLSADDGALVSALANHIKWVFTRYGGELSSGD